MIALHSPVRLCQWLGVLLLAASLGVQASTPAPTPAPASADALRAKPGEAIAFGDLPGYVGTEVVVTTTLGTQRRGVITGASSISIVIKLVREQGGFTLSMPSETVVTVHVAAIKKD